MTRKCCVPGCDSERKDVKWHMHKIPLNREKATLWVKVISAGVPSALHKFDALPWEDINRLNVCHMHFEAKYILPTMRLAPNACPTLFSSEEICSGTPTKTYNKIELMDQGRSTDNDHTYSRKRHYDHSYARDVGYMASKYIPVTLGVSMHRFPNPNKYPDRFASWVTMVGDKLKGKDPSKIYSSTRVCDHHFDPVHKISTKRLKPEAIPLANLNGLRQTCSTFAAIDHSYTHVQRESVQTIPLTDIRNLPDPNAQQSNISDDLIQLLTSGFAGATCEVVTDEDVKQLTTFNSEVDENSSTDGHNDDYSAPSPVPEMETARAEPLYSWEKPELIPADEPEPVKEVPEVPTGVSLDDETSQDVPMESVALLSELAPREVEYRCKECGETIKGFQFWCVQCLGCALCGACEARGAHHTHYVLRAPPHRPHRQTQVVLAAIRHQLQNEYIITPQDTEDVHVKLEVKEEPMEEEETREAPSLDPLAALDHIDTLSDDDSQQEDDNDIEEITEPQPKRAKLADFIEKSFFVDKPKGQLVPAKVAKSKKVTKDPPPIIDVEYLDEELENLETNTKELDSLESNTKEFDNLETNTKEFDNLETNTKEIDNLETNTKEFDNLETNANNLDNSETNAKGLDELETNSNIMILGDSNVNIVVQRVVTDDENEDTCQILGNVGSDWIVRRGVTADEMENRLPLRVTGPEELMARSITRKAVVKLQPLSSLDIRRWSKR